MDSLAPGASLASIVAVVPDSRRNGGGKMVTFGHPACARCRKDTISRSRSTTSMPEYARKASESGSWLALFCFSMAEKSLVRRSSPCFFYFSPSVDCCPSLPRFSLLPMPPARPGRRRQSSLSSREGNQGKKKRAISESDRASLVVKEAATRRSGGLLRPLDIKILSLVPLFFSINSPRSLPPRLLTNWLSKSKEAGNQAGREERKRSVRCRRKSRKKSKFFLSLSKLSESRGERKKKDKVMKKTSAIFFFFFPVTLSLFLLSLACARQNQNTKKELNNTTRPPPPPSPRESPAPPPCSTRSPIFQSL